MIVNSLSMNQLTEPTSDEVHNFLEPAANWVGYHPMGGGRFPGATNVPHLNIIRDNGKADGQRIYFNRNTLSLSYCHGTDNAPIDNNSVISWKQMHVATVHAITVTDQDRSDYRFFAKNIREEIRDVADSMIEAAYMDIHLTALSGVKNIVTSLGFRKLRGSLCARATDLLLELEEKKRQRKLRIFGGIIRRLLRS
jgi:hypothetical protein